VSDLQKTWQSMGVTRPLRVRMGINTGYCTVGNFGSDQRLEYTVLGSPVNLAARLEAAAEANSILLSESTYLLVRDVVDCTQVGDITPKGFLRPVGTYRLNGFKPGFDAGAQARSLTRVGQHVEVNIPDSRKIREAIEELKRIQEEFEESSRASPRDD